MIDIIRSNPYRILGVFSTSSKKEIVANKGKMKAFLKVGKSVMLKLDFKDILGNTERTFESVLDADSKLVLAKEQLKYAQFWFCKKTPFDDIAFNHLLAGNRDYAISIWEKKDNVSSLQNRIVCAFIKDDINSAISYAEILYSDYADEFVKMVLGDDSTLSSTNLSTDFLDILCEYIQPQSFVQYITNNKWKDYVGTKTTKPLIENIQSVIDISKKSKGQGASARYKTGVKLISDTKTALANLRKFLKKEDLKYQMIVDKLGLEILQCGIDYYNESDESDAEVKAMKLQKYAQSVVIGKIAKERCDENVKILEEIIRNLPPLDAFTEDKKIKEELAKFCRLPDKISYAISLLNTTKPSLQSIKTKLGVENSYYLKVSTQVVGNALHNIIEDVNNSQEDENTEFQGRQVPVSMLFDRDAKIIIIKSALKQAWEAIRIIDTFDLECDFKKSRYNENRKVLKGMCEQLGISTSSYPPQRTVSTSPHPISTLNNNSSIGCASSNNNSFNDTNWRGIIAIIIGIIGIIILFAINN